MLESNKTNCFDECPMLSVEFIGHPKFNTWNISNPLLVKIRLIPVLHFPYEKLPSSWPSAIQSLSHLRISSAAIWKMTKLRHIENLKTFRAYRKHVDDRTPRFWWRFPNIEELSCLLIEDLPSCPMFPSVEVHTRILSLDLVVRYMGFGDPVGRDNYLVFPSNLRLLCIGGCFSTKKMILNIARLKNLERLTLKRGFPWGKIEYDCWDFTNVEFPAVEDGRVESFRGILSASSATSYKRMSLLQGDPS
ncbi:hypothetical protein CQW23_02913 [Capsicum baccatum]|uniref:Uncharacterized protein n=1 Tax=Capsicum baccatum TaxID=33114 RepID=A0A2G2XSV8_CAPBA|nr:hypothetical protein CQW23_02913 [Capsicum baccatum]